MAAGPAAFISFRFHLSLAEKPPLELITKLCWLIQYTVVVVSVTKASRALTTPNNDVGLCVVNSILKIVTYLHLLGVYDMVERNVAMPTNLQYSMSRLSGREIINNLSAVRQEQQHLLSND